MLHLFFNGLQKLKIEGKHRKKIITWDICDSYASISEKLLGEALDWAGGFFQYYPKRKGHNLPCEKIVLVSKERLG